MLAANDETQSLEGSYKCQISGTKNYSDQSVLAMVLVKCIAYLPVLE